MNQDAPQGAPPVPPRRRFSSAHWGLAFGLVGVLAVAGALVVSGRANPPPVAPAPSTPAMTALATPPQGASPQPTSPAPTSDSGNAPPTPTSDSGAAPTANPLVPTSASSDPAHIVTVEDALTFDPQDPNTTSAYKTIRLSNEGGTAQPLGQPKLSGANADAFAVLSTSCTNSLDAASGCLIDVTFTPPAEGDDAASLDIPDANGNTLVSVALKGTGQSSTPSISVDSSTLSFDQSGGAQSATVSNGGKYDASLSTSLGGANADYYSMTSDCGTVSGGGTCSVSVTFNPPSDASSGIYYGTVTINNATDGATLASIDLSGTVADTSSGSSSSSSTIARRLQLCMRHCPHPPLPHAGPHP